MKIYEILSIFSLLFIAACANIQAPSGGPEDKTPPKLSRASLDSVQVNFRKDKISIEFNEYVDKNRVIESLSISPRARMSYDWSGKEIEINFEEPLKGSTTYMLTLSSGWRDIRGNASEESRSWIFSTGPEIDSAHIAGSVFSGDTLGVTLGAWRLEGFRGDTLDISSTLSDYIAKSDKFGNYKIGALKPGTYRLAAWLDRDGDGALTPGVETFSTAWRDAKIASNGADTIQFILGNPYDTLTSWSRRREIGPVDTGAFRIVYLSPRDSVRNVSPRGELNVLFSGPADSALFASSVKLVNTADSTVLPLTIRRLNDSAYSARPAASLNSASKYRYEINFGAISQGRDSSITISFQTMDVSALTSASGGIVDASGYPCVKTPLFFDLLSRKPLFPGLSQGGSWKIEFAPEGEFGAVAWCDLNGDEAYDFGSAFPFRRAEPAFSSLSALKLRQRWSMENTMIIVK